MLTDVVTHKGDATKRIKGALLGLLIILSAVLILETINPNLVKLNILKDAPPLGVTTVTKPSNVAVNIPFGSRVNTSDTAGAKRLKDSCKGKVVSEGQSLGKGGINTFVCYANPVSMDARIGDKLDTSIYSPADRDKVATSFKNSCVANGGNIGNSIFGISNVCRSNPEDETPDAVPIL